MNFTVFHFQNAQALRRTLLILASFHLLVIVASNYLVQIPVQFGPVLTTWGAFTFPLAFLTTDLTVRALGQSAARRVVAWVMLPALAVTYVVSVLFFETQFQGWASLGELNLFVLRIAVASGVAFVVGQLVDIAVFSKWVTRRPWWLAPVASTCLGGLIDTALFFFVAFYQSSDAFMADNWPILATTDYLTKQAVSLACYLPLYGALLAGFQKRLGLVGPSPVSAV